MLVTFKTIVPVTRTAAWNFAANFQNISAWDPGVKNSKKVSEGAAGVGSEYELVTLFKGNESTMKYTVAHWDPPNKLVITGDSSSVAATDTIVFTDAPTAGHTAIEYTADIRLKGLLSLFTFFVASDIRALGDAAKTGLERAFAEGKHTEPSS